MEEKKVLLSVRDLEVKFRVRSRILTAIRGISLDIYENESIAIVGESGSGKSVFTKTFAGMLDENGFIANGDIIFNDDLEDTYVPVNDAGKKIIANSLAKLNEYSKLEPGSKTFLAMKALEEEKTRKGLLTEEEENKMSEELDRMVFERTEKSNYRMVLDPKKDKEEIKQITAELKQMDADIKQKQNEKKEAVKARKEAAKNDTEFNSYYEKEMARLSAQYKEETSKEVPADVKERNELIAKEIYLSVGRYTRFKREKAVRLVLKSIKEAMEKGLDLSNPEVRREVFDEEVLYVKYLDEDNKKYHGECVLNLAKIKYADDWTQIRGQKIATVFQDPMTSLNPIITIGKQISSVIMKHQNIGEVEAREKALELMKKVGIPNAENRFEDYPFQYSGGMRQRIVIAIALSCQPKILICDEPTTALDVTIQAQILQLIKDLKKEYNYTIVFITHDLGVVANVADRVAVLYAGQLIELGTAEEVFYDPKHPYTWALLSSLPQLAQKDTELYSITGTPPSLYNKIVGDAFAPRNPYSLKIDTLEEAPMFKVTETHYAKTWLLDPRAPKIEKPKIIENIHEKLIDSMNI
ncbi:MAG: ATP-binding cassette domain-containing protein [Erysipelotrichaceae bacterium]|nr:ATP-binding cassette domain-containing protein [Erysipelotrichaceae bacterium]